MSLLIVLAIIAAMAITTVVFITVGLTRLLDIARTLIEHIPKLVAAIFTITVATTYILGLTAGTLVLCTFFVLVLALHLSTINDLIGNSYGRIRQLAIQSGISFRLGLEHGNILPVRRMDIWINRVIGSGKFSLLTWSRGLPVLASISVMAIVAFFSNTSTAFAGDAGLVATDNGSDWILIALAGFVALALAGLATRKLSRR